MRQLREWDSDNRLIASGVEWKHRVMGVVSFCYWTAMAGFPVMGFAALNSDKQMAIFGLMMFLIFMPIGFFHWKTTAIIFHRNGRVTAPHGIAGGLLKRSFHEIFFDLTPSMRVDEEYQSKEQKWTPYEVVLSSREGYFYKLLRNSDYDGAFLLVQQIQTAKNAMIQEVTRPDEEEN